MGSYAGSSDWDDVPATESFTAFKPARAGAAPRPAAPAASAPGDPPAAADDDAAPFAEAPAQKQRLNAIFAFDTTGSMTPWVESVQQKMEYLAVGLLALLDTEIALIGVGDHGDGRNMLQITPFSADPAALKQAIQGLRPTDGGDTPEAFECLFKVLGARDYDVPTVMVLITDSIPHGMEGYEGDDDGCPFGVDYRDELADLRSKLTKIYLVSCATDPQMTALQRRLVGDNAFLQLADVRRLVNLVMALCMEEAGELDYFMRLLERQRGPERRAEVLALLGRRGA